MFVRNLGQFDEQVVFQAEGGEGQLRVTGDSLWLTLWEPPVISQDSPMPGSQLAQETRIQGVTLRLAFIGADPTPGLVGLAPLDTRVSYFVGNDPTRLAS